LEEKNILLYCNILYNTEFQLKMLIHIPRFAYVDYECEFLSEKNIEIQEINIYFSTSDAGVSASSSL